MGRYWDAIRAGLEREKRQPLRKLNRDERQFQAAAVEILETGTSPTARVFTGLIITAFSGALIWSWVGHVDTFAIVQGRLIPRGKVQVIESLVTGTVRMIHAQSGDVVQAGQLLVELDPTEHTAERTKLSNGLSLAELTRARLRSMIAAVDAGQASTPVDFEVPDNASDELIALQKLRMRQSLAAFMAEQSSLGADIEQKKVELEKGDHTLEERRQLASLTLDRRTLFQELENRGVGIRSNTIDARQSEQEQRVLIASEEGRLAELRASVLSLEARRTERRHAYVDGLVEELVDAERTAEMLKQELAKAELLVRATTLRAPVSGTVQQLDINTVGEVVQSAQQLMIVVPTGTELEIEAMLQNKDKGFVREGQEARVKVDAFPFTQYGTLTGHVRQISNDATPFQVSTGDARDLLTASSGPLVFPIRIRLSNSVIRSSGQNVQLTPGYAVTAEIKTGSKQIIEYLLDPILEAKDESFHER